MDGALSAGRRSFDRRAWGDAYAALSAADRETPLALDDLERLAVSAFLVGEDAACMALTARAHQACVQEGDAPRAARCAFWLAFSLLMGGEMAQASGWTARVEQLLDAGGHDCVERGFLLLPGALGRLVAGDAEGAVPLFTEALAIGERFGDIDLVTFGRLGRGQALVAGGHERDGVAEFDLVMVAVTSGEVSPVVSGVAYCGVIEACQLVFDLGRAREWTAALSRWCDEQPDLVPYRGQCLVHRAEILQLDGTWGAALEEAERACQQLSRPPGHPAVGGAWYRVAELLRLRGDDVRAEEAYRAASEHGRDPQPGLALLRLARGQPAAAAAAIRRALDEAPGGVARAPLLAAGVEILLATGDREGARAAAAELAAVAAAAPVPALDAMSAHAQGLVLLAEDDHRGALALLRAAWASWRSLHAPYEGARVRVAVGLACRGLGDDDGARLELDAAASAFRQLGAAGDLALVEDLVSPSGGGSGVLSSREVEVLRLVATGRTNRAIAAELVVSEKTVARHLANIFTKLRLSSRSAATAYAYEHGIARRAYTP